MSRIAFSENAWEEYLFWQFQDKRTLKKINTLLKAVQKNPFTGAGKPEELKGINNGKWSRRINDKDRLVYQLEKDMIVVIQCMGHYNDK